MDRRFFVVPGGLLVVLVLISGAISVVHWQADLYATEGHADSVDVTTVGDLPGECRRFARSLAAGGNVSIEEYRVRWGTSAVLLRDTGAGWVTADARCASRLASATHLRVGNRPYDVYGDYSVSGLHRRPPFQSLQLVGGLLGVGALAYGLTDPR